MVQLIAFEGIDASGKETQARMLAAYLLQIEKKIVLEEAFPRYYKPIGQVIRKWLDGEIELNEQAVHMLYEADRQDFMSLLETTQADFAVLDRFTLSNLAFGMAKGIGFQWLRELQDKVRKPDLTFVIDIDVDTSFQRRGEGRDRHEQDANLLQLTRGAYHLLESSAAYQDERIFVLDGLQSPEALHDEVKSIMQAHYPQLLENTNNGLI